MQTRHVREVERQLRQCYNVAKSRQSEEDLVLRCDERNPGLVMNEENDPLRHTICNHYTRYAPLFFFLSVNL